MFIVRESGTGETVARPYGLRLELASPYAYGGTEGGCASPHVNGGTDGGCASPHVNGGTEGG